MSGDLRDEFRSQLAARKAQLHEAREQFEQTSERIEKRAGRNLFIAIGSGLIFGAAFVLALFLWTPLFALLVATLVSIASIELATAFRGAGRRVPRIGVALSSLLILAGAYFDGARGMILGLLAGLTILTLWRLIEGLVPRWQVPPRTLLKDVISGAFTLVYVAFFGAFAVLLVLGDRGEWWVFTLVVVVVLIDTGAYASGVLFGRTKMTPRISPNKTWEGFAGGAITGIVSATLLGTFVLGLEWWAGVILGILLILTATGGDLTESLIKRNLGVKDMSTWIPGHGGFLDRLDSILPSTAPVYAFALVSGVAG